MSLPLFSGYTLRFRIDFIDIFHSFTCPCLHFRSGGLLWSQKQPYKIKWGTLEYLLNIWFRVTRLLCHILLCLAIQQNKTHHLNFIMTKTFPCVSNYGNRSLLQTCSARSNRYWSTQRDNYISFKVWDLWLHYQNTLIPPLKVSQGLNQMLELHEELWWFLWVFSSSRI